MPNLRNWIEAQLKRGRTKQQIKGFLVRKGYPQAAVAEVDKIAYTSPSARTLPGKKIDRKIPYSLILILAVVGVIISVGYFMGGGKGVEEKPEVLSAVSQVEPNFIDELCKDYPKVENEISCSKAIEIATARYPGDVSLIRRVVLPDNEIVWHVEMSIDSPIIVKGLTIEEKVKVIIDAKTSEIISTRPVS